MGALFIFWVDKNLVTQGIKTCMLKKTFKNMLIKTFLLLNILRLNDLNLSCLFFILCFFNSKKRKKRNMHTCWSKFLGQGVFECFIVLKPSFIHLVKVQKGNMESITAFKKHEIDKKINTTVLLFELFYAWTLRSLHEGGDNFS